MRLAVVAAEAEDSIRPGHRHAKDDREVERVGHTLAQNEVELVITSASNDESLTPVAALVAESEAIPVVRRQRFGFFDQGLNLLVREHDAHPPTSPGKIISRVV
jgi:hypothetical protein